MKSSILFFLLFTVSLANSFAEEPKNIVASVLKSALVYRNGAELTHTAKATLKQGNNELVIDDIGHTIDINSIRIHCSNAVTVMAVSFSTANQRPDIISSITKRAGDSIQVLEKETSRLGVMIKADNELIELLRANKQIRGEETGLSVAELVKMMDYYRQKSLELQTELSGYEEKQKMLNNTIDRLRLVIRGEENKACVSGKLLLQLMSAVAGDADFTISYLTTTAFWNPSYDLRMDNINNPLQLVYKAKLVQTSGLDWKQVKLTLSTSAPAQHGNAPLLKTWFLKYIDPVSAIEDDLKSNTIQSFDKARSNLSEVVVVGYGTKTKGLTEGDGNEEPLYIVSGKPMDAETFGKLDQRVIKDISPLGREKAMALYGARASNGAMIVTLKEELGDYVSVTDNQLNVNFDIDIPYDVPGNGKEQQIILKEYAMASKYTYYAVPKLDKEAYLLGEVKEWEKLNLLPGEANVVFEGTYVGRTFIDPHSTQDTLNLTLGNDKRVVVKREKVSDYSSTKFLGSNRKQVFTYETTVKNNKKEKIEMLLKDQYPISSTKDIEVELLESNGAVVNDETGVLSWKLQLAAGETKKLRVSYSIRYPKDKQVNVY